MSKSKEQIISAIYDAGVIGGGGGGFPTYAKLKAKVDIVIANGSECEPILASDCTMMERKPEWLISGVHLVMQATGAKQGIIALKKHYTGAVKSLTNALPSDGSIKLHLLDNYYPAGDEFLLVHDVTGKAIPEGGIPLNVGVLVNNAITLMQVFHAVNGKPVTERAVTIAGEFKEPKVVTVPIGTTYNEIVKIGGGFNDKDVVLIDGGPMMGKIVEDLNDGIGKTTSGVLALPKDHFVVSMKQKTLSQMIKKSKSSCCQCFRCTDLCPRNLLGHDIYPHMTMRTVDYNQSEPACHITSAFLCSQCGMCELIACDFMMLSPRQIYAAYKKELIARGVKNPHKRQDITPDSQLENRKISVNTVMKKLDLMQYDVDLPYMEIGNVKMVRIPINKHIGTHAVPTVRIGQRVRMCDIIAASPKDELGTIYHASIEGKITDINQNWVEITK